MTFAPDPLRESLFLIYLASLLVPTPLRADWRREWESEIWCAWTALRDRTSTSAALRSGLRGFSLGSFADAFWLLRNKLDREAVLRGLQNWRRSQAFCLGSLCAAILLIGAMSGFFATTRSILLPLPYAHPERIATVAHGGLSMAVRTGIPAEWVRRWQLKSKLLEGAATYGWREETVETASGRAVRALNGQVSEEFFPLLDVATSAGRTFRRGDALTCGDCALVSYEFWHREFGTYAAGPQTRIILGGRRYRVIGVLDRGFWFLSRNISVWTLAAAAGPSTRMAAVIRLSPDVTLPTAQAEMESILGDIGLSPWDTLLDISPLQPRVRSVFGSFALALGLALVMTVAGLRSWLPRFGPNSCARALFFASKTALLLIAVLAAGLEFTRAGSITMIGGTDLLTEPLSTWLFLMASLGALTWSIFDQRRRCRVCLKRLGMAAHVGCPGCLLLNWAGMELVCMEGHGMLHVPEMSSSLQDAESWTALDDSWTELFQA